MWRRSSTLSGGLDVLAIDGDGTGVSVDEAVDGFQGGGFAAAGRTNENDELSIRDLKVEIL